MSMSDEIGEKLFETLVFSDEEDNLEALRVKLQAYRIAYPGSWLTAMRNPLARALVSAITEASEYISAEWEFETQNNEGVTQ